jgi:hypothetical protein
MSGVRVGTRLDHLLTLRKRLEHEIRVEQRRNALDPTGAHDATTPTKKRVHRGVEDTTAALLQRLGVTSRTVKEWAVSQGIYPAVPPGRVSLQLVESYAKEHQPR